MPGWIRTIGVELWGLFVDDIGLAISAALWVALIATGCISGFQPRWRGRVSSSGWRQPS